MVITQKALDKMSEDMNKKYYSTVVVYNHYDGSLVGEEEVKCLFYKGDECNIKFNGIVAENFNIITNKKKWWQFWK